MNKFVLLTPGPTMVPERIGKAMQPPIIHHRAPAFVKIFTKVCEDLKYVFCTKNDVFTFAASGTGAMESAVVNLLSAGDKAVVVVSGKFGERWKLLCEAYGVNAVVIDVEWGKAVKPAQIEEALRENPDAKAVFTTLSETSTGVVADLKTIGAVVAETPAALVVDAISGLGATPCLMDEWQLDVVVAGSQKALMLPPGLAFAAVSEKAMKLVEASTLPKFYFDYKKYRKMVEKNQTPYTPAVSLILGLQEAINMIKEEGLENVYARHARLAKAARAAVKAMGLEMLSSPEDAGNICTAVKVPDGVDGNALVKIMRDEHKITITGGQEHLKGKIFRISHLGYVVDFDLILGIAAIEMSLKKLGADIQLGSGVAAAQQVFMS